jgi:DNA modification methylase
MTGIKTNKNARLPVGHALPNTPVYAVIRYWGRKPWNIVRQYIEYFTKPGEIIFDPFSGCGVAAIESLKTGRKAIYNDLNKFAHFIIDSTLTESEPREIDDFIRGLKEVLAHGEYVYINGASREKILLSEIYETICPDCHQKAEVLGVVYSRKYTYKEPKDKDAYIDKHGKKYPRSLLKTSEKMAKVALEIFEQLRKCGELFHDELVEKTKKLKVRPEEITRAINDILVGQNIITVEDDIAISIEYHCKTDKCIKKKLIKTPDPRDLENIKLFNKLDKTAYCPKMELKYDGNRFLTYRPGTETIANLFTSRNIIALSFIKEFIEAIDNDKLKKNLLLCFAAILEHVSKMQRPNKKGWTVKNYIIHPTYYEMNVFNAFLNRLGLLKKAKVEFNKEIKNNLRFAKNFEALESNGTIMVLNKDILGVSLPSGRIDYIFTDPEYGPSVQYYELSQMASAWLGIETDWRNEIVVNKNQQKDLEKYRDLLTAAFEKCYAFLKPNGHMTVTFHSREIKYWNALMYSIQTAGFKYVDSIYQIPQKEYTNWIYARNPGEMNGDVYVTFKKPPVSFIDKEKGIDFQSYIEKKLVPHCQEIINIHGGSATYNQLVRGISLFLIQEGLMHNPYFRDLNYEIQVFDIYFDRVGNQKVWENKKENHISPIDYIPLDKRINWIIHSVFNESQKAGKKVGINDILEAVFTTLKNSKTPENKEIISILNKIASPSKKAKVPYWLLRGPTGIQESLEVGKTEKILELPQTEEIDHDRMIMVLSRLGKEGGFNIKIGEPELRKNSGLLKYQTANKVAVPGIPDNVNQILANHDVIYLSTSGVLQAIFEVEHSTNIKGGILRISNIFDQIPNLKLSFFLIVPDDRISALMKAIEEPAIKRIIAKEVIYYATYSDIMSLFDSIDYAKVDFGQLVGISQVLS